MGEGRTGLSSERHVQGAVGPDLQVRQHPQGERGEERGQGGDLHARVAGGRRRNVGVRPHRCRAHCCVCR